ncbi:hypothetical protein [Idiomarina sp.]|nr:hypothetical protein [Idiomarina sp.]
MTVVSEQSRKMRHQFVRLTIRIRQRMTDVKKLSRRVLQKFVHQVTRM